MEYIKSAFHFEQCPEDLIPEVALIGRSNAGKSTFINVLGNHRIAKVSGTPGKTNLINFYAFGKYRWVDLPGYGYAKRPAEDRMAWQSMIETYLGCRANLVGAMLLIDVRRNWSEDERQITKWLQVRSGLPSAVILTKADKLSKAEQIKAKMAMQRHCPHVFLTSSLAKSGFAEVEDFVYKNWVRPRID